jgi:hypothetical protein
VPRSRAAVHVPGEVGLVLDTPAILAYATHRSAVGERLFELADADQIALLPALCLAEAYRRIDSPGWDYLDVLSDLPHSVVAPVERDLCSMLGGWARSTGSMDLAHAALEAAVRAIVPIMTNRAELLGDVLARDWPIIGLD